MNYTKITELRNHVPLAQQKAYFITGSTGLIPDFVYNGVRRYLDDRYNLGGDSLWNYPDGDVGTLEMMRRSKKAIADMIGCRRDEICFGQSSSQLFNMFVQGFDFSENDNVVSTDSGWIGTRFAMQQRQREGVNVRFVKGNNGIITADDVIAACDENTKLVTVNYIESFTGYKIDADKIGKYCKEHNIIFALDAVQALGIQNIDVKKSGIDFIVGNDYKWMMNFCGCAYAYISRELFDKLHHMGAGWMSDDDRFNSFKQELTLRDDAGRFELGYPNSPGIYGLGLVAAKYNEIGRETVSSYVNGLSDYLRKKISETNGLSLKYNFDADNLSQINIMLVDKSLGVTEQMLAEKDVIANFSDCRQDDTKYETRICIHLYTSKEDIDKLISCFAR